MHRGVNNLSHGGPADRALPVMVQHISHLGEQTRASANRIMEVGAANEATDAQNRLLERDNHQTCHLIDSLYEELTTDRAEVKEYQERHMTLEEQVIAVEHRIAEL